jgi:hypothetical protein
LATSLLLRGDVHVKIPNKIEIFPEANFTSFNWFIATMWGEEETY